MAGICDIRPWRWEGGAILRKAVYRYSSIVRHKLNHRAPSAHLRPPPPTHSLARFTVPFPVADHRRMNPKFRRQLRQGLSHRRDAIATRALNSALCCFLFTPTSHVLWTGQPLAFPSVQKSGTAAMCHWLQSSPAILGRVIRRGARIR